MARTFCGVSSARAGARGAPDAGAVCEALPGRLVTRTMLLERVWDFQFDPKTSVVETHMSRLRAKLDRPFGGAMIRTERGMGYILDVPETADRVARQ